MFVWLGLAIRFPRSIFFHSVPLSDQCLRVFFKLLDFLWQYYGLAINAATRHSDIFNNLFGIASDSFSPVHILLNGCIITLRDKNILRRGRWAYQPGVDGPIERLKREKACVSSVDFVIRPGRRAGVRNVTGVVYTRRLILHTHNSHFIYQPILPFSSLCSIHTGTNIFHTATSTNQESLKI